MVFALDDDVVLGQRGISTFVVFGGPFRVALQIAVLDAHAVVGAGVLLAEVPHERGGIQSAHPRTVGIADVVVGIAIGEQIDRRIKVAVRL